jgi:clan AA aspartic protease
MLTGRVTAEKEAVVEIQVLGSAGKVVVPEAAIDTGYNGYLTLPGAVVRDLDLPFVGTTRATLGDGHEVKLDLFSLGVVWEGESREVLALSAEGGVLLGIAMLAGTRVTFEVETDGAVSIESLAKLRSVH